MSNVTISKEKVTIPAEKWVAMYASISHFVLEYASLDTIYIEDENVEHRFTHLTINAQITKKKRKMIHSQQRKETNER